MDKKANLRRRPASKTRLPSNRNRINHIVANVRGVVWEAWRTPEGNVERVDFVNPQLEAMLGYSAEDWASKPNFWLSIVHPEDYERAEREVEAIFSGAKGGTSRFRWVGRSGRILRVETQAVVICDERGVPTGMRGVTMDVTERVEAEERFLRQLTFNQALTSSLAEGMYALDASGLLSFINPAGEQALGWSMDELQGKFMHDVTHFRRPDGSAFPARECRLQAVARTGEALRAHEDAFVRKDGRMIPVICSAAPIIVDGSVSGAVVSFQDISERKRSDRRRAARYRLSRILAESSEMTDAGGEILASLGDGLGWTAGALWLMDGTAEVLRCADFWRAPGWELHELEATLRTTGMARGADLAGRAWARGAPAWVGDVSGDPELAPLLAGTRLRSAFASPIHAGSEVLGVLEFFGSETGEPDEELIEIMTTVGSQIGHFLARRRAESGILKHNEDLNTLLHVISHDLKEPLRAVESFSGLLEQRYLHALDPAGQDLLRRVVRAADRLHKILDDILTISRARRMGPAQDNVGAEVLVREALARVEHKIAESGASVRIVGPLPQLRVERVWATAALYNLIVNALKFTRPGVPPEIEIVPYRPDGSEPRGIGIEVHDRGLGVDPAAADRIFELFGRAVGREIDGTGAGLAIVREVALHHGGKTWVRPRAGGGSEFVITFGPETGSRPSPSSPSQP